jgi:serine protease inhibitor
MNLHSTEFAMLVLAILSICVATCVFADPLEPVGLDSSIDQFASDLYLQCVERPAENLVISPFSVGVTLALTAAGAKEKTFDEIKQGLHLSGNKNSIADQYRASVNQLMGNVGNATIKTANKIYVADDAIIKPEYKDIAVNKFNSDIEATKFTDGIGSAGKINAWAAEHTANRIKDIISPDDLDSQTRAILINAVYFKAIWKHQFSKSATRPDNFYVDDKQTKTTNFMHITNTFKYREFPEFGAKAVELPYADSDITFLIIVPIEVNGLSQVQNHLKNHDLQSISNKLSYEETAVSIPRFEIEYKVTLNEKLKALGIRNIFEDADLSDFLVNSYDLYVSKIIQKAFIKVDEEGAEAAAVTAVVSSSRVAVIRFLPQNEIKADRPFVYAIRKGGITLFIGQYVEPVGNSEPIRKPGL